MDSISTSAVAVRGRPGGATLRVVGEPRGCALELAVGLLQSRVDADVEGRADLFQRRFEEAFEAVDDREDPFAPLSVDPGGFGHFEELFERVLGDEGFEAVAEGHGGLSGDGIDDEEGGVVVAGLFLFAEKPAEVEEPEGVEFERVLGGEVAEDDVEVDLREVLFEVLDALQDPPLLAGMEGVGDVTDAGIEAWDGTEDRGGALKVQPTLRALGAEFLEGSAAVGAAHRVRFYSPGLMVI